jgi:hypothetical protein
MCELNQATRPVPISGPILKLIAHFGNPARNPEVLQ